VQPGGFESLRQSLRFLFIKLALSEFFEKQQQPPCSALTTKAIGATETYTRLPLRRQTRTNQLLKLILHRLD
jgi:hypothetical protein